MGMSVLSIIQTFTDKLGLPRPTAFIGATDKSTRQYSALLRETIADLGEHRWQQQRVRVTFTSLAATLQGNLTTLFGAGYAGLVKDSIWNDTRHMRIFGPISDQAWNALQTLPNAGPEYSCWISRDNLYVSPDLPAGETIAATVITSYNVSDSSGTTFKELVTDDADLLLFPDNVVLRLFEAKWRQQKGESGWEDHFNDAMGLVARNIVREGGTTLKLDCVQDSVKPGIIIPPGNWGV
jgi:hypothetical protein